VNGNRLSFWFSLGATGLAVILAFAGARAQSTPPQASPSNAAVPKLAEQEFKNIQALKGISADQLIPSMQFIAASLGVECEYCHVARAFDKDDKKPKVTAREMIAMMMAINKENFEGHREVTCYSCHRGSAAPVGTPIITDEEPKPAAAEGKQPGEEKPVLPTADQLLDKYLSAVGGAAALQKIATRVEKGSLTMFGDRHVPVEVFAKAPDKRYSVMHLPGGDSVTAYNGKVGWQSINSQPPRVRMSTAAENAAASIDADFYFPAHLKSLYEKFQVQPGEKISGRDTYLVIGEREGQPPIKLYLDTESGLLLRLVRYAESPLGRLPTQIDYADYRDANGVKIPFRWTLARPGNRFTIQVDDVQQNVPVDDAKFTPPPIPPPPAQPAPAKP
jgi:photosynthetic reaction center cytochrome c subunit